MRNRDINPRSTENSIERAAANRFPKSQLKMIFGKALFAVVILVFVAMAFTVVFSFSEGFNEGKNRGSTVTVGTYTSVMTITLPIVAPYYAHPIFHIIDGLTNKSIPNAYLSLQGEQGQYIDTMRTNETGYAAPTEVYLVSVFQGHSVMNIVAANYATVWIPVPISNNVTTIWMYPISCFVGYSGCLK